MKATTLWHNFTGHKPVKGKPESSFHYDGATYWFASKEHQRLFRADPEKYKPQYGAFCGYAVSIGKLRPVDPAVYQIENGRLILQHTKGAYDLFNKDLKNSITTADADWPGLVTSHVGKPSAMTQKRQRRLPSTNQFCHSFFRLVESFYSFREAEEEWPPKNKTTSKN